MLVKITDWKTRRREQEWRERYGTVPGLSTQEEREDVEQQLESIDAVKTRAEKFTRSMELLKTRKVAVLQQMLSETRSVDGLHRMRLEKGERNLLAELSRIVAKEERYVLMLRNITAWFDKRFHNAGFGRAYGPGDNLGIALSNEMYRLIHTFETIFDRIVVRLDAEKRFLKRWRGRTFLDVVLFWRKNNVLDHFDADIVLLRKSYEELDELIAQCLRELPSQLARIKERNDALQRWRAAEENAYQKRTKTESAGLRENGRPSVSSAHVAAETNDLAGEFAKCLTGIALGSALNAVFGAVSRGGYKPGGGSFGGGGASGGW